jgi:hypothetical protein
MAHYSGFACGGPPLHRTILPVFVVFAILFPCFARGQQQRQQGQPEQPIPCYADVVKDSMPRAFQGFGTWGTREEEVKVTIHLVTTANTNVPCSGQPLAITVPNRQKVNVDIKIDPLFVECVSNVSITEAPSQFPIAELMGLIPKGGFARLVAPPLTTPPFHLTALRNKVETITTTCNGAQGSKYIQSVAITYQNPPRVAVSAGFVAAPGVKSFGIKTMQTGVGAGGVVTTQNSLAVTGSPSFQFIPFSFANIYYAGSRTLNLNAQLGLGVNPNLSSSKLEFFASPLAIGWRDVYFSPGFHIGQHERLTGGFTVGELTPSGLSKAPSAFGYFTGFGFSISYNLKPLVKSASAGK